MRPSDNTQSMKEAGEAMQRAVLGMEVAFARFATALGCFGLSLRAAVWHPYMTAGAPYGETLKGLNRWLCERQAAA